MPEQQQENQPPQTQDRQPGLHSEMTPQPASDDPAAQVEPAVREPLNTGGPDFAGEPSQGSPLLDSEETVVNNQSQSAGTAGTHQTTPTNNQDETLQNQDTNLAEDDKGRRDNTNTGLTDITGSDTDRTGSSGPYIYRAAPSGSPVKRQAGMDTTGTNDPDVAGPSATRPSGSSQ